jgi:hypothetical protein
LHPDRDDPHPVVLLCSDNLSSKAWSRKDAHTSYSGRALGSLQCALMLCNPVGIQLDHISTHENVVADSLS